MVIKFFDQRTKFKVHKCLDFKSLQQFICSADLIFNILLTSRRFLSTHALCFLVDGFAKFIPKFFRIESIHR